MIGIESIDDVRDDAQFGGKASQLGAARRFGLPVPPGAALSVDFVEALAASHGEAHAALDALHDRLETALAVRSSAIGEDSAGASFAGQHISLLNVRGRDGLREAVLAVRASAFTESALAYRRKLGLDARPRIGVVVQRLVAPECAGVLFSRNPMTGADERVIEAAWGLGEAVVAGLVTPDRFRIARDGRVLERCVGTKDLAIRATDDGGTCEVEVEPSLVNVACLDDAQLARLNDLTGQCEAYFGGLQDLEWAFAAGDLYLLQRREITTRVASR